MLAKKRLLTRSDFDGLVCAALLKELDIIDEIRFVHPKDMQDTRPLEDTGIVGLDAAKEYLLNAGEISSNTLDDRLVLN